jgi:polyisoprenoid-binding protein YceI
MTITTGTHAIGPANGRLRLRTTREGMAARVGHDLEIEFAVWSGEITVADATTVSVRIETDSFTVVSGTGGVAPLTDADRKEIKTNALKVLGAAGDPTIEFHSDSVRTDGDGATVTGTLSIAGHSAPVTLQVEATGTDRWRATGTVRQTAVGIKPYRAFLGALRLADAVGIEIDVDLSG